MAQAQGYSETRDALARDWVTFLAAALPEPRWMPVPNLGAAAVEYARDWELDGLILTGGDDLGSDPLRDLTERALLKDFLSRGLPILGVCRGLQLFQTHFGGVLQPCDDQVHVATRHTIRLVDPPIGEPAERTVNSFHTLGIVASTVPPPLRVLACSGDGLVEALWCAQPRLLGLMWHPEREAQPEVRDRQLIRWLFGYQEQSREFAA